MSLPLAARVLGLVLLIAGGAAAAHAAAPSGTRAIDGVVSSVVDGDSLWLRPAGGGPAIEVRLAGIDAPEICQPGGPEARAALARWALKKPARLRVAAGPAGVDAYGRRLGTLEVGGADINRRLVERGLAWSAGGDARRGPYAAAERRARAQGQGLHRAGDAPLHPREFRRRHGPCPRPQDRAAVAAGVSRTAAAPAAPRAAPACARGGRPRAESGRCPRRRPPASR